MNIKPHALAEIINRLMTGMINSRISKIRFSELLKTGKKLDPVRGKTLDEIIEESEIEAIATELIDSSDELVKKYKSGKTTVANYFVGKIMQRTKSNTDPKTVLRIVKSKLDRA
ncbi:MAG: hypothetical protein K9J16_05580 [Melioribacteraceae bacterium]|nr:hypothetical protein [Melioribacteraceae bacterium]MCF8353270.1 hypothetical protein [Melioribacteraceae bacterium]MCF8394844.1 hypothetical protein [Melioribacteraceae bacterium]MCF8418797.1 hypothetical protein [Melioribacteraceae bacterium]